MYDTRETQCPQCGKPFYPRSNNHRYCSDACRTNAQRIKRRAERVIEFVAIDGEGWHVPGEAQAYGLLAASSGETLTNRAGIDTLTAFTWLLSLRRHHSRGHFVVFSGDYDVNMWLRDIPRETLQRLARVKTCLWRPSDETTTVYQITHIPRKLFRLSVGRVLVEQTTDARGKVRETERFIRRDALSTIEVSDVWGFYQSSFVRAIEQWIPDRDQEQDAAFEHIKEMKLARGAFDPEQLPAITTYNRHELALLVELMRRLNAACERAGIFLHQWHGAGAIAGELMHMHNVAAHLQDPPKEAMRAVRSAYFGGRVQALRLGEFDTAYSADLNSAYPAALVDLPSMIGSWRYISNWRNMPIRSPWLVVHVTWECIGERFGPFPVRDASGRVTYPLRGDGWYWYEEVEAAAECYSGIEPQDAWQFIPDETDAQPFAWIRDLYAIRQQYKANNDPRHIVLKLGINSVYGRLAQRESRTASGVKQPTFQSLALAGLVTARTRARIMLAIRQNPAAIISIATDGILSTERLPLDYGDGLGQWEADTVANLFMVQSGFYYHDETSKTRGVSRSDVSPYWLGMRALWRVKGIDLTITIPTVRFITYTRVAYGDNWHLWRHWVKEPRVITTEPDDMVGRISRRKGKTVRIDPPLGTDRPSVPYQSPVWREEETDAEDKTLMQPALFK